MATYDFSSVVQTALNVVNGKKDATEYAYPLVYPSPGQTIVVKLLFNPKSGQISRLLRRHDKIACYKTFGIDCPICKIMEQVIDVTGQDPFKRSSHSTTRGISFAQFISSTSSVTSNNRTINQGDTILFMYPWSVYTQINALIQAISQSPSGMEKAFCTSDGGLFVQVSVTQDFKYTTVSIPYMTFPTGKSNEEYMKMLDEMPSLNEQVLPSTITQEVDAQVKEYVDNIHKQYISPRLPNTNPTPGPVNLGSPEQMIMNPVMNNPVPPQFNTGTPIPNMGNTVAQTPTPSITNNSKPACFGNHVDGNPQCICCPDEVTCMQVKGV